MFVVSRFRRSFAQSLKGAYVSTGSDGSYYFNGEVFNTPDCTGIGWSFSDKSGDCVDVAGGSQRNAWANGVRKYKHAIYDWPPLPASTGLTMYEVRYDNTGCSGAPELCMPYCGWPCPVTNYANDTSECRNVVGFPTQARCIPKTEWNSYLGYEEIKYTPTGGLCTGSPLPNDFTHHGRCQENGDGSSRRHFCVDEAAAASFDWDSVT